MKIKAYTDYLQAASSLSSRDPSKHNDARVLLTDAKIRISIYGTPKVVSQIATFDRMGSTLNNLEGMSAFLEITMCMRQEEIKNRPSKNDMAQLIFGQDLHK